jgi:hypothetical protein
MNVNMMKTEIEQLEKTLNALVHRPQLIRREYWISQIEGLLEQPGLSPHDRLRLLALRDMVGLPAHECAAVSP